MYSVDYPCCSYDQTLDALSLTKTNSPKTSSLPLADFGTPRETFLKRRISSGVLERVVSTNRKPIIASNILRRLFRIGHQELLLRILNLQ